MSSYSNKIAAKLNLPERFEMKLSDMFETVSEDVSLEFVRHNFLQFIIQRTIIDSINKYIYYIEIINLTT